MEYPPIGSLLYLEVVRPMVGNCLSSWNVTNAMRSRANTSLLSPKAKEELGRSCSRWRACIHQSFFAESIINPNAVLDPGAQELGYVGEDGESKMPDYNSVLTIKQVADLAAYLSSLQGEGQKPQ